MNRTTLIITIGIIIAVCTGIYLYTEWEKARFDASLAETTNRRRTTRRR